MVGRQLSRYRIVEEVGSGGMAVVYRGVDTSLDREVAVKVLHPHLAGKEESRRRFSREAKAVARLHHPNILEIYDFSGDEAPESFIITEFIRGKTLRKFAEEHALQPPELAGCAVHELADALEHAHAIGVIHRDLKPENVMIREDGCLKLTDFGIAKILDREEKMTMTGALVGSPAHMAPEIIEGDEARAEADIFSLGTILYWLCTQKLPFVAANTTATLKRILDGQYDDPRLANPRVSDGLCEIIARCLAREPTARYRSAAQLRDALGAELKSVGLDRPAEELANFFADPDGASAKLTGRLVASLLAQARELVQQGKRPRAMAALSRVLALDPHCAEALALLESLKKRSQRAKLAERVGLVAAALALLSGSAWGAWRYAEGLRAEHARQQAEAEAAAQARLEAERREIARQEQDRLKREERERLEAERKAREEAEAKARAEADLLTHAAQPGPGKQPAVVRPAHFQARVDPGAPAVAGKPGSVGIFPYPFADILIDGTKRKGDATSFQAELPPGDHTVVLENAHAQRETFKVTIKPGEKAPDLRVLLVPLSARLVVAKADDDVGVEVNGKVMGTARMSREKPIEVFFAKDANGRPQFHGRFSVTLTKPGFHEKPLSVELRAGETTTIDGELEPE